MSYKTSLISPSVKWHSRKDGPNGKNGFKGISPFYQNIEAHIPNLLLSMVPHVDRKQSPSALMSRQIRAPITMSCVTEEKVWYIRNKRD